MFKDFAPRRVTTAKLFPRESALEVQWFLRNFGYDAELLRHDQVDVNAFLNLQGVACTLIPLSTARRGTLAAVLVPAAPDGSLEKGRLVLTTTWFSTFSPKSLC